MSDILPAEELLARVAQRDVEALGELYDRYAPRLCGLMTHILSSREGAEETLQEIFLRLWTESPRLSQEGRSVVAWLVVTSREAAVDRLRALRRHAPRRVPPRDPEPFTIPARPVRTTGGGSSAAGLRTAPQGDADRAGKMSKGGARKGKPAGAGRPEAVKSFPARTAKTAAPVPSAWLPLPRQIALIDERLGLLQKVISQLPKPQRQALELAVFEGLGESEIAEQMGEPLGRVRTALRAAVTFVKHRRRAVCGTWVANI